MAKKKSGFNMAAEIRELLERNSNFSGKEIEAELKKKYPREKINSASCGVAFSNARKKMGLARKTGRKSVRKRRPASNSSSVGVSIDLASLQAAKQFLAACGGDASKATAALRQLNSLQL